MSEGTLLIARDLDFAARKHVHQRHKGLAQEPYINHLAEVARLLAEATDGKDANLVAAGLLHETIEDQGVLYEDLVAAFDSDVANLVREVTDDKTLAREERKRLQIEHAGQDSERARMLKIADKTSNLRALTRSPPADWAPERRRAYFTGARHVVAGCRGVNARLEAVFDAAWEAGVH